MNLKEAFRYQKFLDRAMNEVNSYLIRGINITKTTRVHKRNDVWEEAGNLEEIVKKDWKWDYTVDFVVVFYRSLLTMKTELTRAISDAKRSVGIDMDAEIAVNVWRQKYVNTLSRMTEVSTGTCTYKGNDYRFNAEGNQVSYVYEIEETTELDFDKKAVKDMIRKINHVSDNVSTTIDQVLVQTLVDYSPCYDLTDSIEDMMEKYAATPHSDEEIIMI